MITGSYLLIGGRLKQRIGQKITPTFSVNVIAKILISDTKCGIERNDFFIVLKAEVFGRELDCISRLVGMVAVNGELHIDIVLCHTTLEVVNFFDHIENVISG